MSTDPIWENSHNTEPDVPLIFFKLNFPSYYVFIVMISCDMFSTPIRIKSTSKHHTTLR